MYCEDFLVHLSICLLFSAVLPKEFSEPIQGVRDLLSWGRDEGGVAKEILWWIVVMGATTTHWEGRALAEKTKQHRDFDSTRGYPGEDGF